MKSYFLIVCAFLFILASCKEKTIEKDTTNTEEQKNQKSTAPISNTNKSSIKDSYTYIPENQGRYFPDGIKMKRYVSEGIFNRANDLIEFEIPVTETTFKLNEIKSYRIPSSSHNGIVVVLKNGNTADTPDVTPRILIRSRMSISKLNLNDTLLKKQKKLKVYAIHDECFESDKEEVMEIFKLDLETNSSPPSYTKLLAKEHRDSLRAIQTNCNIPKIKDFEQPKTSNGGVITGE